MTGEWVPVCRYDDLLPERGVAALVAGHQVALFRTFDGVLHALDNRDPFTGQGLTDPAIAVVRHDVRRVDGSVELRPTQAVA